MSCTRFYCQTDSMPSPLPPYLPPSHCLWLTFPDKRFRHYQLAHLFALPLCTTRPGTLGCGPRPWLGNTKGCKIVAWLWPTSPPPPPPLYMLWVNPWGDCTIFSHTTWGNNCIFYCTIIKTDSDSRTYTVLLRSQGRSCDKSWEYC